MSDKEKEPAQKEEDESEDESQLKIVEEEAPSQSGQEKEDHEEPTTTSKAELTSPTMNNNNELASPSTSSQKAGGSGMGLGKGPKNVQPNFDFDYEGPPVTVSNGMALELVNRFGLNNAWGAFLKLKGYHTPYDKNAPQPPEHVQALKRFRRKIRTVREMFNSHRDKNEDTNPLMSKEFVILLKTSNGNEGGGDSEHAGDDSTIADAPIASTSMEKKPKSKKKQEEVSASVTQPITVQIDNGQAVDANTSSNGAVPADPTHPKRPRKSTKKDTKRDSVIAAATSSNTMSSNHASTSTNAKNQSKIDEIVSGVIDRVMAANQKDSSKGGQAPESIPQTAQMLPPTLGVEQLQELYRLNPALFNTFNAQQGSISGVQSLLSTVKSSTALNPSVTAPLQLNTGTHQANPAKLLLHGLPGQQQPAFLDSQTAQLFFPPSTQTPLNTPAIGAFGVASPFLNTAAIRAALHQHHGPLGAQVFPGSVTLQGAPGQLVPHWLGQLETSVGLPQQLLAPVSQSTSSQKHSAHSGTSTDKPLTINVQQTEDDEDEDESEQKIDVTVSPMTNKSGSKANHKEDTLKMETKGRKPSRASTTMSATNSTKEEKQPSPRRPDSKSKPSSNHSATTPTSAANKKTQKELDTLIADLRDQVEQLENQLNAERTKFSVQKRRMDMMRDKLKKKDDELQTARIDYACQKTDNATLKHQLETLRTENDEFRKRLKEPPAPVLSFIDTPTTSRQIIQASGRGGRGGAATRGRKTKAPPRERSKTPVEEPQKEETPEPPAKPPRKRKKKVEKELEEPKPAEKEEEEEQEGRRQSKRLAGARSRVLYSTFS